MTRDREQVGLTPEGESRRAAILRDVAAQLPAIAARRRARRRVAMAGGVTALLLPIVSVIVLTLNQTSGPGGAPAASPVVTADPADSEHVVDFAYVRTSGAIDPSVYIRPDTEAINAMVVTDDELLRELASIGRPAGLIRMNGELRLTDDVVDPEDQQEPRPF